MQLFPHGHIVSRGNQRGNRTDKIFGYPDRDGAKYRSVTIDFD
jgi:hypothetical protein